MHGLAVGENLASAEQIVIKMNLCAGDRYVETTGVVSNQQILAHLIDALRLFNGSAKISLAESDSSGGCLTHDKFQHQNLFAFVESRPNVELLDLSRSQPYRCSVGNGLHFKEMILPHIFCRQPFIISLGKIKTHFVTGVTGCMKNLFGCLADTQKYLYHPYIDQVIVDITSILQPDLCIVEGYPAMEGPGPEVGNKRDIGPMLLGNNAVAVDAVMCKVMGFDPKKISHICLAWEHGLGEIEVERINLLGDSLPMPDPFEFIPRQQQFFVWMGLRIQQIGQFIAWWGHAIHNVRSADELWTRARRKLGKLLRFC